MSRVVAAMSGGVDSSVVAGLLLEQGHEVIGVHMKLHDADPDKAGHCCGLDDALDARRVADRLGIPFHVMDLRQAFKKAVIDNFTGTYLSGGTPNPCIQCNGVLKFDVLLKRSLALGADYLATGHYARIGEGPSLMQAVDTNKDQSYFLFPMDRAALAKTLFPLGGMTKAEVREHAKRFGLVTASKPESQDICFVPDGDHARVVREAHPETRGAGTIVDGDNGRVVGTHDGYWRFTVGQRRGLGVAMGKPVYVSGINAETGTVTLRGAEGLWHTGLTANGWVWTDRPPAGERVEARIRHRGQRVACSIEEEQINGVVRVNFEEPAWAVAPGQAVVLYRGDKVLGGGWIRTAIQESE